MKKLFSIVLAFALMLTAASALAAGKINVDKENLVVTDGYTVYGYVYAKISNVGDKPVKVNAGVLELYDTNGDVITSSDWLNTYAEYLEPGQYTYAYIYDDVPDLTVADVADYLLTVTGKSEDDKVSLRLPVEVDYQQNVTEGYWTYDYMYATVTNNTDQPIYDVTTVLTLLDADGNILYMTNANMFSDKAIMPGSSIMLREYVPDNFKDAYTKAGLTPVAVDAIAYVNVEP